MVMVWNFRYFSSKLKQTNVSCERLGDIFFGTIKIKTLHGRMLKSTEQARAEEGAFGFSTAQKGYKEHSHYGALLKLKNKTVLSLFTSHAETKFTKNFQDKAVLTVPNRRVDELTYIKKNLPFKYINPPIVVDQDFLDNYITISFDVKHLPKTIKDYYVVANKLNSRKLFHDTVDVLDKNFRQTAIILKCELTAEGLDFNLVKIDDKSPTLKEFIVKNHLTDLPAAENLLKGKWEKKMEITKVLEDEDF